MSLRVRRLAAALGAEITDIDLSRGLTEGEVDSIATAWQRYGVLAFPDQHISDADHARFARYFGSLDVFPAAGGSDGSAREIYCSSNTDSAGRTLPAGHEQARLLMMNWFWHADGCYRKLPNKGVVLRAIQVVENGGNTVFANMETAYAALPATTKRRIADLFACHSFAHMVEHCGLPRLSPQESARLPMIQHPLVWKHRGGRERKSLFLSPPYMESIVGLSIADSRALIEELIDAATQKRFLYCHRWRRNDVLMWDNRWTMHKVTPYDLARERRVMHGATLRGTEGGSTLRQ